MLFARSLFHRSRRFLTLLATVLVIGGFLYGQDQKKGKKRGKAAAKPVKETSSLGSIGELTPVGKAHKKLEYKDLDLKTGIKRSEVQIEILRRDSEDVLAVEGMKILKFTEQGKEDMTIEVEEGKFTMSEEILRSRAPTKITREGQFEIVGEKMIFNTKTNIGKLMGHVKMRLFNVRQLTGDENDDAKK